MTIAAMIAFLAICTAGPVWLDHHYGPGGGLIASLAALVSRVYPGPPPSPGFGSGTVCLNGFALIAGREIVEFLRCIR